jgi:hypothetical protein
MVTIDGCQLPCLPRMAVGPAAMERQPLGRRLKRALAAPWNYHGKRLLKRATRLLGTWSTRVAPNGDTSRAVTARSAAPHLMAGDWVLVRSREEIEATLDPWKELKGCAFLEYMWPYCGTTQRVLQPVERFLDERDYRVKRCRGVVFLENLVCRGTPVFGRCDRCCYLFWREEWLEQLYEPST